MDFMESYPGWNQPDSLLGIGATITTGGPDGSQKNEKPRGSQKDNNSGKQYKCVCGAEHLDLERCTSPPTGWIEWLTRDPGWI
jgi:hypothetical protein